MTSSPPSKPTRENPVAGLDEIDEIFYLHFIVFFIHLLWPTRARAPEP